MLIKKPSDLRSFEITPEGVYARRRDFLRNTALLGAGVLMASTGSWGVDDARAAPTLGDVKPGPFGTDEELTPFEDVTSYNNFYELGTGKDDPKKNAHELKTEPWSVTIDGEVVDLNGLSNGIYLYRMLDEEGKEAHTGRLSIIK